MTKWLVIGGAAVLTYLLVTSSHTTIVAPGDKAKPLPQAPPVQNPAPLSQPQTTVVPGASTVLQDIKQATGIAGDIVDIGRKFGLFGSGDQANVPVRVATPDATVAQGDGFAAGAAFF